MEQRTQKQPLNRSQHQNNYFQQKTRRQNNKIKRKSASEGGTDEILIFSMNIFSIFVNILIFSPESQMYKILSVMLQ